MKREVSEEEGGGRSELKYESARSSKSEPNETVRWVGGTRSRRKYSRKKSDVERKVVLLQPIAWEGVLLGVHTDGAAPLSERVPLVQSDAGGPLGCRRRGGGGGGSQNPRRRARAGHPTCFLWRERCSTRLRSRPVREKKRRRSSPGPAAQVVVVLVTLVVMGAIVINSRVAVFVPCSVALGQSPSVWDARSPPPCPGLGGRSAGPTRENYRARAG